ncbi:hypothetical protein, partial [Variovorax boronicumulans]|uniref:hypothetical protein n=1 Tax=Variovorax boronicumulans TaxID=436515 RepID=UPI0027D7D78F
DESLHAPPRSDGLADFIWSAAFNEVFSHNLGPERLHRLEALLGTLRLRAGGGEQQQDGSGNDVRGLHFSSFQRSNRAGDVGE